MSTTTNAEGGKPQSCDAGLASSLPVDPVSVASAGSTGQASSFDHEQFRQRQRRRLQDRSDAFAGDFGKVLWRELSKKLQSLIANRPLGPDVLADCLLQAPVDQIKNIFFALKKASTEPRKLTRAEADLLAELVVLAATRVIDISLWCAPDIWCDDDSGGAARVSAVKTRHSLLAAVGFAGLQGLEFRLGTGQAPDGVIDLTDSVKQTDAAESLLRTLYDTVFVERVRRPNPYDNLNVEQLTDLKYYFDELRYDDKLGAIFVRLDVLDSTMRESVMTAVAKAINSHVVLGDAQNDPRLALPRTALSVDDVNKHVMELLPFTRATSDSGLAKGTGGSPATSAMPHAVEVDREPGSVAFRYDLFISHASEDKADFVDALVGGLKAVDINVWYDKEKLKLGDSISVSINQALRESRFGLVVFSPHFLTKSWTQAEQQALFSMSLQSGKKRLLSVLYGTTVEEVTQKIPLLSDQLFCDAKDGLQKVLAQILTALN